MMLVRDSFRLNCLYVNSNYLYYFYNDISVTVDELDDYPDSLGSTTHISGEAASQLLDTDDSIMEIAATVPDNSAGQGGSAFSALKQKWQFSESLHSTDSQATLCRTEPATHLLLFRITVEAAESR
jgi:hypothetical protein